MYNNSKNLVIIMPVYNEEKCIENVIDKWTKELLKLNISFTIKVYDDGSTDNTFKVIQEFKKNNKYLEIYNKKNEGHGPTILKGYCENLNYKWIFQVDSDDEMDEKKFKYLWEKRKEYDFILGQRDQRKQPISRYIVSMSSRFIVKIFYGNGIYDVNSPYRLMRTERLKECFLSIPKDTFAPNVIITGFSIIKKLKILEIKVLHKNRQTGECSINKIKTLLFLAIKSLKQTICYKFHIIKRNKYD